MLGERGGKGEGELKVDSQTTHYFTSYQLSLKALGDVMGIAECFRRIKLLQFVKGFQQGVCLIWHAAGTACV